MVPALPRAKILARTDAGVNDGIHGPREIYRPLLEPVAILNRICRTAELRAQQQGVDPWEIISDITGHGSGVSNAIYKVYRQQQPEVANPPE